MAKYSALILFVTLAVFWSSADARYNKYQDDVINAMSKWAIEEMRDVPEPYKSRLINKLTEAKNKEWDNLGEYFKYVQQIMLDTVSELYRSKRSIHSTPTDLKPLESVAKMLGGGHEDNYPY